MIHLSGEASKEPFCAQESNQHPDNACSRTSCILQGPVQSCGDALSPRNCGLETSNVVSFPRWVVTPTGYRFVMGSKTLTTNQKLNPVRPALLVLLIPSDYSPTTIIALSTPKEENDILDLGPHTCLLRTPSIAFEKNSVNTC